MDPNELAGYIDNAKFEMDSCRLAAWFGEEDLQQVADGWEAAMNRLIDRLHE